ncbi:MAG: hypothetical protein MJ153_07080 [Clostridia bacterium]|nr:hypothetical protein [Clostridia bacterium]
MKAKRKIALLLSTVAVIGCLAIPAFAGGSCYSSGVNCSYNGSVLEYKGYAYVSTDSKGAYAYLILGNSSCRSTWCKPNVNNKACYSNPVTARSGSSKPSLSISISK